MAKRILLLLVLSLAGCAISKTPAPVFSAAIPDFTLTADQSHNKFSRAIPPAISVPTGSVVEVFTREATGGQLTVDSTVEDLLKVDFDKIHALTGPVYVEGAEPGDVLAVKLHAIEVGDWGWASIFPGFSFLADEYQEPVLKTFLVNKEKQTVNFAPNIVLPLKPFAGVMGVAPATDEMLTTIPPRANGGNMDDPNLVAGTTVYFPVFVKGALFSIGDTHAVQGLGEVAGTAVEAPMRIVYELNVIKGGRRIAEPQYETAAYYATTGFATTIDEAAKKATRYMIDYLVDTHDLTRNDAYILCSLAGNLKIAEVVDAPNMLVTMHMPKHIFSNR